MIDPRRLLRAVFAYFVLGLALSRAVPAYAATVPAGGDPWMAGDWLINYGGGFVRRGLFGELFLAVAPGGEAGLWLLFGLQNACYLVVLAYVAQLLHVTRYAWSTIALVCAPAGLAFIGWDTAGGFRKEILVFVVLALLAWSRREHRRAPAAIALITAALALYVVAVLSWEPSAFLLPAVAAILLAGEGHLTVFRRTAAAVFAVVALLGGAASMVAHGDVGTALAVCESVRSHGFGGTDLCGAEAVSGGGIEAVGWTSKRALADVAASFPLYVGFIPYIALALVPAVTSTWFREHRRWGVLVALGVVPMYLLVTDYGRWTHIVVMALMFCATAVSGSAAYSPLWNPLVTVFYVSLWGMPHHLAPDAGFEWLGAVHTVVTDLIRFTSEILDFPLAPGLVRQVAKP